MYFCKVSFRKALVQCWELGSCRAPSSPQVPRRQPGLLWVGDAQAGHRGASGTPQGCPPLPCGQWDPRAGKGAPCLGGGDAECVIFVCPVGVYVRCLREHSKAPRPLWFHRYRCARGLTHCLSLLNKTGNSSSVLCDLLVSLKVSPVSLGTHTRWELVPIQGTERLLW